MHTFVTRRRFLATGTAAFGTGILAGGTSSIDAQPGSPATVAVVVNENAVNNRNVCSKPEAVKMVAEGLRSITGQDTPGEAWRSLGLSGNDVVGVKINCNSWTFNLSAHPPLVRALCESMTAVVPENSIIIYERNGVELARAGFPENDGSTGVRCLGADSLGYVNGLTRIVTDMCTKVVNFPSLKTVEAEFGGSLFLKNHIGSLPPAEMPSCHGDPDVCTEVCARPEIRDKTILNLCDGLRGSFKRGVPWYWGGIVMSTDTVASERAALDIINEKRVRENTPPLAVPGYVQRAATDHNLGTVDPSAVDVVRRTL